MPQLAHEQSIPFNPVIESLLGSFVPFEADGLFCLAMLGRYEQELALLAAGANYKSLGIGQRRKNSLPSIIRADDGAISDGQQAAPQSSPQVGGAIAHLKLLDFMQLADGPSSYGARSLVANLRQSYQNPSIKGVILEVDSGGGESAAGTAIAAGLSERNKPIVALVNNAGSAAYRAIASADEIVAASEDAKAGSIGTFIEYDEKTMAKLRERMRFIYSEGSEDKNQEFREFMLGNLAPMQKMVNELGEEFRAYVQANRPIDKRFNDTLRGRVFKGQDAKKRGLFDAIGGLPMAIRRVDSLSKNYKNFQQ